MSEANEPVVESTIEKTEEEQEEEILDEETSDIKSKIYNVFAYKFPKWALILFSILPSLLIAGTIILVDYFVGFPENINPIAIIGIIALVLIGIVVLGDMAYRNFFIYRMIRRENTKSKIYKDIIKEKQQQKDASLRYDYVDDDAMDDDYVYEDDDEEVEAFEEIELEDEEEIDEYEYNFDEEDPEDKYYKMKSLVFSGGIFTVLILNGVLLLILAFILQTTYGGGFNVPTGET